MKGNKVNWNLENASYNLSDNSRRERSDCGARMNGTLAEKKVTFLKGSKQKQAMHEKAQVPIIETFLTLSKGRFYKDMNGWLIM